MLKLHLLLVCSIILIQNYSSAQTNYNCTWTNPTTGDVYNFNSLASSTADYSVKTSSWNTFINVCRQTINTTCGTNVAACQTWPGGKAALGSTTTAQWAPLVRSTTQGQKGATVSFGNGTSGRAFEIDFQCVESAGVGSPNFEVETPKLFYNFAWPTKTACPTGNVPTPNSGPRGLSGGSIFLILLLCLVVVYVAAGITFNVVKKKASGKEIIPNVEFWGSIPGLVKDGVMFIVNSTCRRGSGYSQVH